jgi:import inner membrane translocase subunit TIM13
MESGFGSDFGGSGSGKLDPGLIMEQVKVQIAVANAQELLQVRDTPSTGVPWGEGRSKLRLRFCPQRMTDKCFRKCIGKPGGSLDNSEQVRPGQGAGAVGAWLRWEVSAPAWADVRKSCARVFLVRAVSSWGGWSPGCQGSN